METDVPALIHMIKDTEFWRRAYGDAYLFRNELKKKEDKHANKSL